jgi:hypothetical protein
MVMSQVVDQQWDDWGFWQVVALFIASDFMARRQGQETGLAQGIELMTDMTPEQREEVMALVRAAQEDTE